MSKARKALRERVHAKYGGRCAYCGVEITLQQMQVDHVRPRVEGGSEEFENLNPACRQCNNYKLFHSLEYFRHVISRQVELCREYSMNFRTAERFGLVSVPPACAIVFHFELPQPAPHE